MRIGYCGSGLVEAVGEGVEGFSAGDRVAGMIGHRTAGNIARNNLVKLPAQVSFEQGAFLSLGVISIAGVRKTRIELGESAMVLGLGVIGLLALQAAKANGAVPVIAVDRAANRLEMGRKLGACAVLDSSKDGWMEELREWTGGAGPDVVIEATGSPEAVPLALQATSQFGRVSLLGCPRGESTVNFYRDLHHKGMQVIGAHVFANPKHESRPGFWKWQDEAECYVKLTQAGALKIEPLISRKIPVSAAEKAYGDLASWNLDAIGTLIEWD
jgi:threonine dehydrogenase-like Zn-dependent dehydrogenase